MLLAHDVFDLGNDVGMLGRNVFRFGDVRVEVVKFGQYDHWLALVFALGHQVLSHSLPVSKADRLLTTIVGKLTVQKRPFRLRVADTGPYFVLFISRNNKRKSGETLKTADLAQLGRYFADATDLIGENRYRWTVERIQNDRTLNVEFN